MSQKSRWTRKRKRKDGADSTSEIQNLTTKTGKVSLGLIETILDEMKNEFNREVNTLSDDECKQISSTESSDKIENPIKTGHGESKASTILYKTEGKSMRVSDRFKSQISSSKIPNESRVRNRNSSSKILENGRNNSTTLYLVAESEVDVSGSPLSVLTASSKRLLRSHATAVNAETEISARVKSSVHSKVSLRKCVLQSTFGTLRQGDDKNSNAQTLNTLLHESSSLIPVDKNNASRTSKNCARLPPQSLKSTRLSQQLARRANLKLNNIVESTSSNEDSASKTNTFECESYWLGTQKTVKSVLSSNTQTYTKTEKHEYRPYKGLSYPFKKHNVRTKLSQRHVNNVTNNSSSEKKTSEKQEKKTEEMVVTKVQHTLMTAQSEQLDYRDASAKSHVVDFPSSVVAKSK
ncbi:hypothetical protein C0J52_08769 [Blattella germanica]|nr:hypothetical protein C0J52_08769 [Blattella germanica]PSN49990.1 hypothetical protein C0J52_08769 [Blattella germanica]